jgi:SAM-dependent methyltransferase
MQKIFEDIIRNRRWLDVPCGSGSTLEYTKYLRENLPAFLEQHGIRSMLDLPCGDHSWMGLVDFPQNFCYTGADILEFMIEQNRAKYPDKEFLVLDLCEDPLPPVDLLFCRDCLFHLSYSDIQRAFANIVRSDIKWVMTTSYVPEYSNNRDIQTGGFRPINLESAPFGLPAPIDRIADGVPGSQIRKLALWPREAFRT